MADNNGSDLTWRSDKKWISPYYKNKNKKNNIFEKVSIGVACCRIVNEIPEIILINKRYTYAYNEFIHGNYIKLNKYENKSNKKHNKPKYKLMDLFNAMSVPEKLNILSLNFNQIWYYVWLDANRGYNYHNSKTIFENTFLFDGGIKLKSMISKSKNTNTIWEIPKGKKMKTESELECGIREFHEESNIPKQSYKIYPELKRSYSYIDMGVKYTNIYFIALATTNINPIVDFRSNDQINEIGDIRWMNINALEYIDKSGKLLSFIKPIFKIIKKKSKGL